MDRSAGMLKLSRRLDADFRVLRYDRRGYGRSFPHAGPFTMDAQVDDLVALLAGRKAVLIGHSYGGNVALATADRHPDLVAGVAVYETPLSWEPWWPGTTAGSIAVAEAGKPREAAERSCVASSETALGGAPGAQQGDAPRRRSGDGRRAGRSCGAIDRGIREEHHRAGHHVVREPRCAAPSRRDDARRGTARLPGRRATPTAATMRR